MTPCAGHGCLVLALFGVRDGVRIEHVLEDSHWFYRGAVRFYNFIQRHAPRLPPYLL